jgi:hypothetical protein
MLLNEVRAVLDAKILGDATKVDASRTQNTCADLAERSIILSHSFLSVFDKTYAYVKRLSTVNGVAPSFDNTQHIRE